mmetsp:Transcript_19327/g.28377  ORF Transcript_19327/g.28377 Transcript_19327/m.28377 type:complete len:575 (-) Transcript_19327:555-2279(-)
MNNKCHTILTGTASYEEEEEHYAADENGDLYARSISDVTGSGSNSTTPSSFFQRMPLTIASALSLGTSILNEFESDTNRTTNNIAHIDSNNTLEEEDEEEQSEPSNVFLLGETYKFPDDYAVIRQDESNLFWFTYRCDFPELAPYGYTTDAGWGCMLRASQMLLAQTLRMHYMKRDWVPPRSIASMLQVSSGSSSSPPNASSNKKKRNPLEEEKMFLAKMLTWFADFAGPDCCYSLHNMVACGLRYEKLPGEWYGPGTACYVIRDLCKIHRHYQHFSKAKQAEKKKHQTKEQQPQEEEESLLVSDKDMLRVFVAQEGCVYRNAVEEAMTEEARQAAKSNQPPPPQEKDTSNTLPHPLQSPSKSLQPTLPWDTSLLLLIPLRLGLKQFNPIYSIPLARTFALPQSVGFLGGSPRHALWFYGASSDGSTVYGLDPHTVQSSPRRDHERRFGEVALSSDYLHSVHCTQPKDMEMGRIDPSLALAFYCKDRCDFDRLCDELRQNNVSSGGDERKNSEDNKDGTKLKKFPELFSVADAAPDYTADVGMLEEMMAPPGMDGMDEDGADGEISDEDEYIFL